MPLIDIRSIPTVVINLDHQPERLKATSSVLSKHGMAFTRFSGISIKETTGTMSTAGFLGCAHSHLTVLSQYENPPVLVLEDDINATSAWRPILDIPKDADAVYLGISKWGYIRKRPRGAYESVMASRYERGWIRVYNMLSAHAILYLNPDFMSRVRAIQKECIANSIPWDMGMARIQKDYIVLTPDEPLFYQASWPRQTHFTLETN